MQVDAVVEAIVIKSKRWSEGAVTRHLVAKYKVADVFKGEVDKDEILIVTDTCLDKPVPREGGYVGLSGCRGLLPRLNRSSSDRYRFKGWKTGY